VLIQHKPQFCHHVTGGRRPLSALLSQYLAVFAGSKVGLLLLSTSAISKSTHCHCDTWICGAGTLFVMLVDECEGDCVATKFTCRKEAPALDIENCRMTGVLALHDAILSPLLSSHSLSLFGDSLFL
jgi:hypothetical protein